MQVSSPKQQVEQQRALQAKERQAAENKRRADEKRQRDREIYQVCVCVFAAYVCECASICGVVWRRVCMASMNTHAARYWFMRK
jgi:hypothetical protein